MSLNIYAASVGAVGYTPGTATASTITKNIDGRAGKRLAIMAFAATPAETATSIFFMTCLRHSTISGTGGASNLTTLTCAAFSSAPATGGTIVIVLDDGTYQWTTVASTSTTSSVKLSSALTDDASAGAKVYYLGLYTDDGHYRVAMTASTVKSDSLQTGLFYGADKGSPIRVHIYSAGSGTASIDYVTYAFINV